LTKELKAPIVVGENFYHQLPPKCRRQFREHRNVSVRGIDALTCYGYAAQTDSSGKILNAK
ncbi:MAG: hypothetical protein ACREOI_18235, partial [bacterium]